MQWKLNSSVVCEEIFGVFVLIAARPAYKECPYVQRVNESGAYYWYLLGKHTDIIDVIHEAATHFHVSEIEVEKELLPFMRSLEKEHYLSMQE